MSSPNTPDWASRLVDYIAATMYMYEEGFQNTEEARKTSEARGGNKLATSTEFVRPLPNESEATTEIKEKLLSIMSSLKTVGKDEAEAELDVDELKAAVCELSVKLMKVETDKTGLETQLVDLKKALKSLAFGKIAERKHWKARVSDLEEELTRVRDENTNAKIPWKAQVDQLTEEFAKLTLNLSDTLQQTEAQVPDIGWAKGNQNESNNFVGELAIHLDRINAEKCLAEAEVEELEDSLTIAKTRYMIAVLKERYVRNMYMIDEARSHNAIVEECQEE
ncbi:hypothetical protein F53441_1284 [Fusarium austroafricanum]|uniref:Uncharacterized protein n=1 Tax=Fusarium austroafricanum TaxID=2364996 RepID=A0A8H4KUX8_9HYPO|nr:hypothetical protein F53441_1284 [Fusarium austroafricanum]